MLLLPIIPIISKYFLIFSFRKPQKINTSLVYILHEKNAPKENHNNGHFDAGIFAFLLGQKM